MNALSSRFRKIAPLVTLVLLSRVAEATAAVKMPAIFGDHMVLQQDIRLPIWGTAAPGEKISASVGEQTLDGVADDQGRWRLAFKPVKTNSAPVDVTVHGATNTLTFHDVLIGDVWVCSGQSNMEFGIRLAHNGSAAMREANYPQIRLFVLLHTIAFEPQADCRGQWLVCTSENINRGDSFSAVAYFFARELYEHKKSPIGLIQDCWGGTPSVPWISLETLQKNPRLADDAQRFTETKAHLADLKRKYTEEWIPKYNQELDVWREQYGKAYFASKAYKDWQQATADAKQAGEMPPPILFPKIRAPAKPLLPDEDSHLPTVLFNGMISPILGFGIKGAIWYQGEAEGMSDPSALKYNVLFPSLITDWRKHWGQGDFPFLFVQLPAVYMSTGGDVVAGRSFPELRNAQLKTLALPNTGMAITMDLGEEKDLHPKNKLDVGRRLALVARHIAYGENVIYSGPIYKSMKAAGNKLVLSFDQIGSGLEIGAGPALRIGQAAPPRSDRLQAFEIAGTDRKFFPARAEVDGSHVVVSNDQIPAPVAVRYAWAGFPNPAANLYNKEGLPASPFSSLEP